MAAKKEAFGGKKAAPFGKGGERKEEKKPPAKKGKK